jgi:hypothetical protein
LQEPSIQHPSGFGKSAAPELLGVNGYELGLAILNPKSKIGIWFQVSFVFEDKVNLLKDCK